MNVGIIGGADGPTSVLVSHPIGQTVLFVCALLLAALVLLLLAARQLKKRTPFAALGAMLVVWADQFVKLLVIALLEPNETAPLLPGFFRLEHVHNYGAAWSSFSGARWLLISVTAVGLGVLIFLALRVVRHLPLAWAMWLVIGGGVANLIDRVRLGYVVDMFAAEFVRFPVFNIADIFVTGGAAAALVYYLRYDTQKREEQTDGADSSDDG